MAALANKYANPTLKREDFEARELAHAEDGIAFVFLWGVRAVADPTQAGPYFAQGAGSLQSTEFAERGICRAGSRPDRT